MKLTEFMRKQLASNRSKQHLVYALIGVLLMLISSLIAAAGISSFEEEVFKAFNRMSDSLNGLVSVISFFGYPLVVPLISLLALLRRKYLNAIKILFFGYTALGLAALIKLLEIRARPAALIENVAVRENLNESLGYLSGHTALATTLAMTAYLFLPKKAQKLMILVAALVALSRLYLGVHLPLDLIGGLGLGLLVGGIFNYFFDVNGESLLVRSDKNDK